MSLTGKQRRRLRALGHALRPVVQVGKEGASRSLVQACDAALADHELIKVKIRPGVELDRERLADTLASETRSELAQILGKTLLLYRPRAEGDDRPRIELPK